MRSIAKLEEPRSLTQFNKVKHGNWNEIHEHDNQHVYDDCINQCLHDQNGLCGYSEMKLTRDNQHIDHYVKRNIDPSLTFVWTNMVAAAQTSKFGANWKDTHVELAGKYDRVSKRYEKILNPVIDDLAGRFKFSADGEMEPANVDDELAKNTIMAFNLNEPSLKNMRKESMQNVRKMLEGGIEKNEIKDYLSSDGFVSAIEYELSLT